jgi:hypothetical protein
VSDAPALNPPADAASLSIPPPARLLVFTFSKRLACLMLRPCLSNVLDDLGFCGHGGVA